VLRKAFDDEEQPSLPKVVVNQRSAASTEFPVVNILTFRHLNFVCVMHALALQHILYRQKEQFSDGVGYSWIDGLKAHASSNVNIDMSISISKYIYKDNSIS